MSFLETDLQQQFKLIKTGTVTVYDVFGYLPSFLFQMRDIPSKSKTAYFTQFVVV